MQNVSNSDLTDNYQILNKKIICGSMFIKQYKISQSFWSFKSVHE